VTQTQSPALVWEMQIYNQLAYRGMRIPSLYPDQIWPANALSGPPRKPASRKKSSGASATPNIDLGPFL
jgi:hypothetical protein